MPKRSSGNTPQPQTQKRIDDQAAESILKKLGEKSGLSVSGHSFQFPVKPFEIVTIRVQGTTALKLPE